MSCNSIRESIPLYYYGELAPEEEERLECHLAGCESCRGELERYRALAAALARREAPAPPELLAECRHDLMRSVYRTPARAARPGAWALFREGFASLFGSFAQFRQPIGAVALLALGFFSARLTMQPPPAPASANSDVIYSSIRSVQPAAGGRVQIALDETRRRIVSGSLEDARIRGLLLAAVREEDNPAVRVESVDVLKRLPVQDVRAALVAALSNDANPAVRLKAVEAMKPYTADSEVRKALMRALVRDENAGVRIQCIDLLVAKPDESMVGVLQDLVQREDNSYVRLKCERALRDMNASVGTF
ncbi:MAG: HEAT repeat domain-containing protein [Bryobacteraceae bacterium]